MKFPAMRAWAKTGEPFVWQTAGALALCLLLMAGLMGVILANGLGFFRARAVDHLRLKDGSALLAQIMRREVPDDGAAPRLQVKRANRDVSGLDYAWIAETDIIERTRPAAAAVIERLEWGDFIGFPTTLRESGAPVTDGPERAWAEALRRLPAVHRARAAVRAVEKDQVGRVNRRQESIRLKLKKLALRGVEQGPEVENLRREEGELTARYAVLLDQIHRLRAETPTAELLMRTADGAEKWIPLAQIVRAYRPNAMGPFAKAGFYLAKAREFLFEDPRESNTEGGVFPAIFGTVMMVLLMSLMVAPLGVLAAFYLREYARQGPVVSAVRIAVNNLAGVPSIVFGVFGVGFFVYFLGGRIDRFFFPEALPAPTFGTGGILWASLTLALLTVPVVIVAAEEGLAAVPRGLREASLALGATKFETTWRVVLPAVMPSIFTGVILAVARAAGEVAPLMITGVVKLAPSLPVDATFPFVHMDRKFMHLGFHVYDVGFQSPNVDAARPMVFATALLLVGIVLALNLAAMLLRSRLQKRLMTSAL